MCCYQAVTRNNGSYTATEADLLMPRNVLFSKKLRYFYCTSYLNSGHYTTSFGSGTSSLELVQTKGKMEVYGFSIAKSGLSITQTGGAILLRDVLNLSGEDENVITQGQVSDATKAIAIATNPNLTVPEPTTATLSLLALVGLASRRRRK